MNIQEYISSGIIESYVLGMASEKEKSEFEKLCQRHPELKQARIHFELTLEEKAFANAVPPPAYVKRRVLETIQQEIAIVSAEKIVSAQQATAPVRKIPSMRWAVAASIALLLGCGFLIYTFYNKNQELESEMARSKETLEKLDEKTRALEEQMLQDKKSVKQVKVLTPQQAIPATINVYWDSANTDVYLVIRDLVPLPSGQQYQLWSVSNGKHTSLGLFDAPEDDDRLILKMNNVQQADSFTITVEKKGSPRTSLPEK